MDLTKLISLLKTDKKLGLTCDSREVESGGIFVAIKGEICDGHDHIPSAIANGADYIVAQKECQDHPNVKIVLVSNPRKALSILAQTKFGNPASKLKTLAVTGTNGKTTTCHIVRSIINNAKKKCGLIGTISYDTCGSEKEIEANMTTPDPLRLAQMSKEMIDNGADFLAIEASSHALVQERLCGFDFHGAAFTNLTGDHLDYHETMENYLAAKSILFESLSPSSFAILNGEMEESKILAAKTKAKILYYGIGNGFDIRADIIACEVTGNKYNLSFEDETVEINSSQLGRYNISNQLAAAGLCLVAGFSLEEIKNGIERIKNVPGRLEKIDAGQNFSLLVDYAHTDDALENVLKTLKPLCAGKLTLLFGCGGDRDKSKRGRMAKVAQKYADKIIVTSDNPRTENPLEIINDIISGFTNKTSLEIIIEEKREKAISLAINSAQENDVVLLAGKGHETYQIIGTKKYPLDERAIAKAVLKKRS